MHYTAATIGEILGCETHLSNPTAEIASIVYDTRRVYQGENALFVALQGSSRRGDAFIDDAYSKGIRSFLVSELPQGHDRFASANWYIMPQPLMALQQLAAKHRRGFTGPVVAITGSNGKTIVKEWLFHLLQQDFSIARSPRSYNSGLGVAISLLGIESWHSMALIEAGISQQGEMQALENMSLPSLGIFTHLGSAHDAGFASKAEKVADKFILFRNCDVLVYPFDIAEVRKEVGKLRTHNPLLKTYSWGFEEGAAYRIESVLPREKGCLIQFRHRSTLHEFEIPFSDQASIENAMSCLCAVAAFERWDETHLARFASLPSLENRMVFMEGKRGNYLVNDSYSNDLDSLEVALDFMLRQQPDKEHIVVLSDLDQADPDKQLLYGKIAKLLEAKKTSRLIGIGLELRAHAALFSTFQADFFETTAALEASGILDAIENRAILIKGARRFGLETVAAVLRKQLHKTVLEIDLNALRNNFSYFRNKTQAGTKMMAMVKAFGYGSGSFEAARTLQFAGADYFAVAYADEGIQLRNAGIHVPIMVMNTGIEDANALLQYRLEPVIFDQKGLRDFAQLDKNMPVHLELDTGMHRLGFASNTPLVFEGFGERLQVKSVFSHLASSENAADDAFTLEQIDKFNFMCSQIRTALGYDFLKHIANSGAIMRFPSSHFDMVRLGIGMYGVHPSGAVDLGLETVIGLKTHISQIKTIAAGDSVGYGRRGIADHDRQIAILPIGYADGLWRKLGNGNGAALIGGMEAPYVGSICMDMAMCDVTGIACKEGDSVEIFGKHMRVETLAEQCQTIPYEILTGVSPRVRREYIGEN
jgi:alanine racemase